MSFRPSTALLHLLVDNTGIKFLGEDEWKRKRHSAEYRRACRKVYLGIAAQTLKIQAIEVTSGLPCKLGVAHTSMRLCVLDLQRLGKAHYEEFAEYLLNFSSIRTSNSTVIAAA